MALLNALLVTFEIWCEHKIPMQSKFSISRGRCQNHTYLKQPGWVTFTSGQAEEQSCFTG